MPMNCFDSLKFVNDTEVVFYDCELAWSFDSQYHTTGDTIVIEVILQQLEIDDYKNLESTLIWKLQKKGEHLNTLYMAHKRDDVWIEVSDEAYQNIGELEKFE